MLRYRVKIQQLRSFKSIFLIDVAVAIWRRPTSSSSSRAFTLPGFLSRCGGVPGVTRMILGPRGFVAIGAFLCSATTMSRPMPLSRMSEARHDVDWMLSGRFQEPVRDTLGRLSSERLRCSAAFCRSLRTVGSWRQSGWFRRKSSWGWTLEVAMHREGQRWTGDLINAVMARVAEGCGAVVVIAGLAARSTCCGGRCETTFGERRTSFANWSSRARSAPGDHTTQPTSSSSSASFLSASSLPASSNEFVATA